MTLVRATTPDGAAATIAALVRPGRQRVVIDGPDAAAPYDLAELVVSALAPRLAIHVRASAYWKPAGQRFEWGKQDEDAYLHDWLDDAALRREVLDRVLVDGRVLPALRDPVTDRSARAALVELPPDGVVVVSGPVLLGRGLPFDLSVHVRLTPAALVRRTPDAESWTLPALGRWVADVRPEELADVVVRADDPRHPAVVLRG